MKPIPEALYPCRFCYDEFSQLPEDLYWSEKVNDWVCENCWDYELDGEERGISLIGEIRSREAKDE